MKISFIIILTFIKYSQAIENSTYIGCYKYEGIQSAISNISNIEDCAEKCVDKSYKYAAVSNSVSSCFCPNFLGDLVNAYGTEQCNEFSVYSLEDLMPGPPKNLSIDSLTEEEVEISWEKPDGLVRIINYEVMAIVLHSFSQYPIPNITWVYSNTTFHTALNLQSSSSYNLTVRAKSRSGLGKPASRVIETQNGVPDNEPSPPNIISRKGNKMQVKVNPVVNNNGPINRYLIVVLDESTKGVFESDYLGNYSNALTNGLNYYITAALTPYEITKNFTIGDNKYYGSYLNAPLLTNLKYRVLVGIESTYNNVTKVLYGKPSGDSLLDYTTTESNSMKSTFLIIIIVILCILIITSIIGFFLLRRHVKTKHRHNRLSEQELTLQGPMISIENSAYLPEDEQVSNNHYKNLKKNVRIFSLRDELSVDSHSIVGKGRFGIICKATLNENDHQLSLVAYTIADKSLAPEDKRVMLKDLDMLIKCGKHDNLIELVGTSESSHMLYVLLNVFPMTLKQFLIDSRVMLQNKFSKVSESRVLEIIIEITKGLQHLEKCKITHTKLCARNIILTDNLVPKIFGFGLADYVVEHDLDYTRWTAVEVFKGQDFNAKSTIWSFGVLLWEICSLGGTPYSQISNMEELIDKVSRGSRLPQLKYFNDEVYQIMLNCWQIDMDERPNSEILCRSTESLGENLIIPFISFQSYQTFEYEQYKPELEFK